ncbi:hypothetical protein FF38_10249, partial [Lucilia cuprina]
EVKPEISASSTNAGASTNTTTAANNADIKSEGIEKENNSNNLSGKNLNDDIQVGRQVAFKLPGSVVDEWIQCEVTKVITQGYRLEVRDPEPDDHGNPGKSYQCRIKDIILLPLPGQSIKSIPVNSVVLAQYPETTAFYKAKVASYNPKRRIYNLKFEGEEDISKETEVNSDLVLDSELDSKPVYSGLSGLLGLSGSTLVLLS